MKKHLLWLPVIFLICSSAIYDIKTNNTHKTEDRNISFVVYKNIDYTSGVYDSTSAQVQITVEKVSGTSRTLVWNSICDDRPLRDYQALANASSQTIMVQNIHNGEEHLEVTYTRTYNSGGYQLEITNHTIIPQDSDATLDISI